MKSSIRNAFSEYHLNKFNVSFEFKLISMVVSITTLLIQAKNHTKAIKSCRVPTPVMSIEFICFLLTLLSGRESLSGRTFLPEFSLANMET